MNDFGCILFLLLRDCSATGACDIDIDECFGNPCDVDTSLCQNTYGSYECTCLTGFALNNENTCQGKTAFYCILYYS